MKITTFVRTAAKTASALPPIAEHRGLPEKVCVKILEQSLNFLKRKHFSKLKFLRVSQSDILAVFCRKNIERKKRMKRFCHSPIHEYNKTQI